MLLVEFSSLHGLTLIPRIIIQFTKEIQSNEHED